MIKWIYDRIYLEHQEWLFLISMVIITLIIVITIWLVKKELRNDVNK